MAQPSQVELQAGADRAYRLAVVAAWLLGAAAVFAHAQEMGLPLVLTACASLVLLRPGVACPHGQHRRLLLYRDGTADLGGRRGTWGRQTWTSGWFSVLRIEYDGTAERVLVCASRNPAGDYRRLLMWSRFKPCGQDPHQRDAGQA
jgi:hypothetical protein